MEDDELADLRRLGREVREVVSDAAEVFLLCNCAGIAVGRQVFAQVGELVVGERKPIGRLEDERAFRGTEVDWLRG